MAAADDDPVVASYDVYMTNPLASKAPDSSSKLFVLQYPSHRPYSKPYNAARSQTPTTLRLKPNAGFLEIEIPMLTYENYNEIAGERYGKTMSESRTIQAGSSHGLAGGFAAGFGHPRLRDVPTYGNHTTPSLGTQILGGKIVSPTPRDPVYLVGCFRQNQLHLSHVDAVVQMRPQLHHIDAEDELNQKRFQSSGNAAFGRQKPGLETPAPKIESKAIEIKIRDSKEDSKDRSLNENARLLRDIQVDEWQRHEWVDEDEPESENAFATHMYLSADNLDPIVKLQSSISNGDWLDKMSAPREGGKKGLLAKLRGRERERARRKKAEEEKRQRQKEATGTARNTHGTILDMSSDSDLSSPDASNSDFDDDEVPGSRGVDKVVIKEEPGGPSMLSNAPGRSASASNSANVPKKRGRPRKLLPADSRATDG
ncbi:uncharacterized protein Z518_03047 [Rhinocladiella mackenziei CBS 650.93]|uniref:Rhinocladiella mackenziei CBS 650.93 unplaced genomic scaffold supercont1.2, whole genome shotgun sequence n=1 Tax=Rhinocladiella mackenziei CBS 650.93 TaxID=1442369 RepID=A0A0D2IYC4_9EURO|nr:uncharacterized protein Z518_03047 [Rhinocladiella mackenziei CBS 650.93]KIX08391.1 hypothetical protein Z518_03047 [Rhinocladiella mackenziei CBS 650.93]